MQKTLFSIALPILMLTACSKEHSFPAGKKINTPASQNNKNAIPIDPKAAAPIATDVRTPSVDPKAGTPMTAGKP